MNNLIPRVTNILHYVKIAEFQKINKIQYFTFNTSLVKPRKALFKYLPSDLDSDEILGDAVGKGVPVIKVTNTESKFRLVCSQFWCPMSYLDKLYNINKILGFLVKIELLKSLKSMI